MKIEGSSNIEDIEYLPEKKHLEVTFRGGFKGRYENVSATVHTQLMNSESKGRYLSENIKSQPKKFPYFRIGKVEAARVTPVHLSVKKSEMTDRQATSEESIEQMSARFHDLLNS